MAIWTTRPAPVSSNQEYRKAGPGKGELNENNSMMYLIPLLMESYSMLSVKPCTCVELTKVYAL